MMKQNFRFYWKMSSRNKFMASGMTHKNIINRWVTVVTMGNAIDMSQGKVRNNVS